MGLRAPCQLGADARRDVPSGAPTASGVHDAAAPLARPDVGSAIGGRPVHLPTVGTPTEDRDERETLAHRGRTGATPAYAMQAAPARHPGRAPCVSSRSRFAPCAPP